VTTTHNHHKFFALTISFFFSGIFFTSPLLATDYYVSSTGNDSNPGTAGSPLRTVQKGSERATNPGDRVLVQPGSYDEIPVTSANGTNPSPITFLAQGAVQLTGFFIDKDYIILDGFKFSDSPMSGFAHILGLEGADNCIIRNNTIFDSSFEGVAGIELRPGVAGYVVENNTISNILGRGLVIRGTGHTVRNNTLTKLNGYDGIHAFGRNHQITGNTIYDSPNTQAGVTEPASAVRTWGISEDESTHIFFSSNIINNFDGRAGFFEQDKSPDNVISSWTISNNIFFNIPSAFEVKMPSVTFINNTFVGVGAQAGSLFAKEELINNEVYNTADGGIFRNNAFIDNGPSFGTDGGYYAIDASVQMQTVTENFVAGEPESGYPSKLGWPEAEGLNGGNPLLVDISNPTFSNFRPADSSPLCQTSTRRYIGAVPCQCSSSTPVPVIRVEYSNTPGSRTVTLSGASSHSCGQAITSYTWNFGDGQSDTGVQVSHTYATSGSKTVQLTVGNGIGQSGSALVEVVVPRVVGVNAAPVLSGMFPISAVWPTGQAVLNGITVTDDHLPNPPDVLTFLWSKMSGPGSVVFTATTSLQTFATFTSSGLYVVRLTASDSVLSSTTDVEVNVVAFQNNAPGVTAGADRVVVLPDSAKFTDASAADDGLPDPPGGLTAEWTQVSGPASATFLDDAIIQTTATFTLAGTYVFALTIDDGALISSDTVQVTVLNSAPVNTPPVVVAGSTQTLAYPFNIATLHDVTVTDDGFPAPPAALTYLWSRVSGPNAVVFTATTSLQTNAVFSLPGTYQLRLTASDSVLTSSGTVWVEVGGPAQAPVVQAGATKRVLLPPGTLTINDASVSVFSQSQYVVNWASISGPAAPIFSSSSTVDTLVTFPAVGTYVLRLNAETQGVGASDDVQVNVVAARLLSINNGTITSPVVSTSSYFGAGDTVSITADSPPAGMYFDRWTGGFVASAGAASTTLLMPDADLTLTATYTQAGPKEGFTEFTNFIENTSAPITIKFNLTEATNVQLTIHTILNEEVITLWDGPQSEGVLQLDWDGRNSSGSRVAPGMYLLVLTTNKDTYTSKIAVVR